MADSTRGNGSFYISSIRDTDILYFLPNGTDIDINNLILEQDKICSTIRNQEDLVKQLSTFLLERLSGKNAGVIIIDKGKMVLWSDSRVALYGTEGLITTVDSACRFEPINIGKKVPFEAAKSIGRRRVELLFSLASDFNTSGNATNLSKYCSFIRDYKFDKSKAVLLDDGKFDSSRCPILCFKNIESIKSELNIGEGDNSTNILFAPIFFDGHFIVLTFDPKDIENKNIGCFDTEFRFFDRERNKVSEEFFYGLTEKANMINDFKIQGTQSCSYFTEQFILLGAQYATKNPEKSYDELIEYFKTPEFQLEVICAVLNMVNPEQDIIKICDNISIIQDSEQKYNIYGPINEGKFILVTKTPFDKDRSLSDVSTMDKLLDFNGFKELCSRIGIVIEEKQKSVEKQPGIPRSPKGFMDLTKLAKESPSSSGDDDFLGTGTTAKATHLEKLQQQRKRASSLPSKTFPSL